MIRWLTIALLGPVLLGSARADGLSYADKQVFSHGYVDLKQAGALALVDYPFASIDGKLSFQTSYRQLYNLKELTDNRAALAMAQGDFILGLALASFGETDYFHQTGLASFVSYQGKRADFGASLVYSRLSLGGNYGYLSAYTINLGAACDYSGYTGFIVARSLNRPRYYGGDRPLAAEAETGLSLKSNEGLTSQVKVLFIQRQKPTAELSQSFRLADYAAINWALVLLPVRFGGGLHLTQDRFGFDYKFSHHPVLGLTHTVMISVDIASKEEKRE